MAYSPSSIIKMMGFVRSQWQTLPIIPQDCEDQVFIITGGNIGLGFEAAQHLVSAGAAKVVIACRSLQRGNDAKKLIDAATGRPEALDVWALDLASFESTKAFAAKAKRELSRLDGLLLNASVALDSWSEAEGMETSIAVNVVASFFLAVQFVPLMKRTRAQAGGRKPHISVIVSGLGILNEWLKDTDTANLLAELNDKEKADMANRYNVSKLLQMFCARQLAALLPVAQHGIVVNYTDPGLSSTNLVRDSSWATQVQIRFLRAFLARTPEMASRTLLHAVVASPKSHGMYLSSCQIVDDTLPEWMTGAKGQKTQADVWAQVTAELRKLDSDCLKNAFDA